MNKKRLEIQLSKLFDYTDKSPGLEQYTTPSTIASILLWQAYMEGNIQGRIVLDAGCGNGILGIGALLLGAKKVIFVDLDLRATQTTKKNCENLGLKNFEIINSNFVDVKKKVNTIVMNPPFGVQSKNSDLMFLKHSANISKTVYVIYKGDGLKIIKKELPSKQVEVIKKTDLVIKKQFSFHTKEKQITKIIIVKIF